MDKEEFLAIEIDRLQAKIDNHKENAKLRLAVGRCNDVLNEVIDNMEAERACLVRMWEKEQEG